MWTPAELLLIDQMIDRESATAREYLPNRRIVLERICVLQKIRMLSGSETATIAMARAAEAFWRNRAEELERYAEEAKRKYGHAKSD